MADITQLIAGLPPEQQAEAFKFFQQQSGQAQQDKQSQIMAGDERAFEDYAGQRDIVADQQAQAEQLRGTETPEGMQVGNQFVAANPLQHIATAGSRIMGNIDAKKAAAEKLAITEKITDTQQNVAKFKRQQLLQQAQAKALQQQPQNTPMQGMAQTQQQNPLIDM